jgi:hypothetical protein
MGFGLLLSRDHKAPGKILHPRGIGVEPNRTGAAFAHVPRLVEKSHEGREGNLFSQDPIIVGFLDQIVPAGTGAVEKSHSLTSCRNTRHRAIEMRGHLFDGWLIGRKIPRPRSIATSREGGNTCDATTGGRGST